MVSFPFFAGVCNGTGQQVESVIKPRATNQPIETAPPAASGPYWTVRKGSGLSQYLSQ